MMRKSIGRGDRGAAGATLAVLGVAWFAAILAIATSEASSAAAEEEFTFTVAVTDPLAKPLACPCVKGQPLRDYDRLGEFLKKRLGRPVRVVYSDNLDGAFDKAGGFIDVVIGKQSVVAHEAAEYGMKVRPLARLTGNDGRTTMVGLFVVPDASPARTLADLTGWRILFGPESSVEKHGAALAALRRSGVAPPATIETRPGCSDGVEEVARSKADRWTATVISSYAASLLDGYGTIRKGDLRVVGRTGPVPFVTAFATALLPEEDTGRVRDAILAAGGDKSLLGALQSKQGFIAMRREPRP